MLSEYYANPNVKDRLLEFLGGASLNEATGVYITAEDHFPELKFEPRPVSELWQCVKQGLDVGRSLWDRRSLIAHLDIEYVNFDHPAEPYIEPTRTFELQQPVVRAIQEVLLDHGIAPLHLLSGRGHHFVWQIDRLSPAFESLARIGHVPESLAARYAQPQPPCGETVEPASTAAFAGLGLVFEYLAHQVLELSSRECKIPIELTAVEAGPSHRGREIVSIDISEYGDPLYTRGIRFPFSAYLKPQQQRWVLGDELVDALPSLFMIPLHEMDVRQGLFVMRDVGEVMELARRASVQIPEQSEGTGRLLSSYLDSKLACFHDFFYEAEHDPPAVWTDTYDRTPLEPLPPCARRMLEQPNELLLKPAAIQHVVRILLAVGWHPRHIAGLIRSKYERDFGWGDKWFRYDATSRADFYTRVFAGLIATQRDPLIDFNCKSTQEKGYCTWQDCNGDLYRYRDCLLAKQNGKKSLSSSRSRQTLAAIG